MHPAGSMKVKCLQLTLQRLTCLSILLLSSLMGANAHEYEDVGVPITRVFDAGEHKAGSQVWWLGSNTDNVIFVASSNGLASWDGERWLQHETPNETLIRSFDQWIDNRIYAGTINDVGFYESDDTGNLSWNSLLANNPDIIPTELGESWSVASDKNQVLFSTKYKLLRWDGAHLSEVEGIEPDGYRLYNVDGELLFMGRKHSHLYTINSAGEVLKTDWKVPEGADVKLLLKNRRNELILVTMLDGIYHITKDGFEQVVPPEAFPSQTLLYNGLQSQDGFYYLTSIRHGVFILDEDLRVLRNYQAIHGIGNQTVLAVHEDSQGNIWTAGEPNISVFAPPHKRSVHDSVGISKTADKIKLFEQDIISLGNGIFRFKQGSELDAPFFEKVSDFSEKTWDAFKGNNQLFAASETGVYAFNMQDDIFVGQPTQIAEGRNVQALASLANAKLMFMGDDTSIHLLTETMGEWKQVALQGIRNQFEFLQIDPQSLTGSSTDLFDIVLWASSTDNRLYRVEGINADGTVEDIQVFDPVRFKLGNDNVALFDIDQSLMIGTSNGVLRYDEDLPERFQLVQKLPNRLREPDEDVFLLSKDSKGRLLYQAGSHTGVSQLSEGEQWSTNEADFRPFNQAGTRSLFYHNRAFWFLVATSEVYRLGEDYLGDLPPLAPLNFRSIVDINSNKLITNFTPKIPLGEIAYHSNSIRISFALADHSAPTQTLYRARISGQGHQNWTQWSSESHKDFPLLAGGHYQFEIEAKDPWGRTISANLDFTILPPWFLTSTAIASYVLLGILMMLLSGWIAQKWRTQKLRDQNLALERAVAERTAQVQEKVEELKQQQALKDRFFANVSHEFRTPLTLTIAPIEEVLNSKSHDSSSQSLLNTALLNAKKMLALVGQVLDVNRLEAGKLPLRVANYDIALLARTIVARFTPWAEQEKHTIVCAGCENPLWAYFDVDQVEKVLVNLLANAIKYSGSASDIILSLSQQSSHIIIAVQDNGVGIDKSAQDKVFERYYQGEASQNHTMPGTGIGLALAKDIIELHKGSIYLDKEYHHGCKFVVKLATGYAHFEANQVVEPISENAIAADLIVDELLTDSDKHPHPIDAEDLTTLLVVDDNAELRNFIERQLKLSFKVITAENGVDGLSTAISELPDLIVSDVSMPQMDGLELTKQLKKNPLTTNIPLILLTAKATKRETVEGFEHGADDYLTKPFDTSELVMRIKAQINTRKKIREQLAFENTAASLKYEQKSDFSKCLLALIEDNLSSPDFSVESMAKSMYMSRETLSRKCKKELGVSPIALLTQVRMHHATNLVKEGNITITEIAYAVGYESLAYFSRTFKKHVGKAPTEYIARGA
ncbi:response regulator [Ningiella sp. W23]|uniref:hybrid sensor histidine kinase/response regulator transcription factor n=1 Tax=Ningiella sp. W23 TaxID=3023715 RepID=UPI003756F58A